MDQFYLNHNIKANSNSNVNSNLNEVDESAEQEKQNTRKKVKELLNKCEICLKTTSIYKCPKCLKKTCSLLCVKQHKLIFKCDGKKNLFTSSTELNENEFSRDVKYMSKMFNETNNSMKAVYYKINNEDSKFKDKKHKNFKKLCKKFRNIHLERCPIQLDRFIENQSFCETKEKKFFWSIRFNVIKETKVILTHLMKNTIDDSIMNLNQIMNYFLDNKNDFNVEQLIIINELENKKENLKILFKLNTNVKKSDNSENNVDENIIRLGKDYYEICNRDLLLMDFLKNKTIYEYPEFYIA